MNDYAVLINNFEEMLKQKMNLVDVIGDCPNIERPIAPETIFWKKVAEESGYECQENHIFWNCRIVLPHNTIIANGSRNEMLDR